MADLGSCHVKDLGVGGMGEEGVEAMRDGRSMRDESQVRGRDRISPGLEGRQGDGAGAGMHRVQETMGRGIRLDSNCSRRCKGSIHTSTACLKPSGITLH